MAKMKAAVFVERGQIVLQEKPIPDIGPLDALMRVTTTTICGTDVHILKGEYPVRPGLIIGHEPVGVIQKLGSAVTGYQGGPAGDRRRHHAVRLLSGLPVRLPQSRRRGDEARIPGDRRLEIRQHDRRVSGGIRLGARRDGQLAPVPDGLTDEQVLMCPDIMSTGFSGAESGDVRIGDTVAVFAQGPIGLCATAGARLTALPRSSRWKAAGTHGDVPPHGRRPRGGLQVVDPVAEIMRLTDGRGVDVAIEALGTQTTFEGALRVLRPGGTMSSVGVYSSDLTIPLGAFSAGLADMKIVTTLCPGGKERMRRLMAVVASGRVDLKPLVTHRFKLDQIEAAYDLFSHQRDGVLKVAITP